MTDRERNRQKSYTCKYINSVVCVLVMTTLTIQMDKVTSAHQLMPVTMATMKTKKMKHGA